MNPRGSGFEKGQVSDQEECEGRPSPSPFPSPVSTTIIAMEVSRSPEYEVEMRKIRRSQMAAPQRSDSSANLLLNLVDGYRVTAVIYVAARLGIADLLLEGSKSVVELARLTDTHERSLLRLMRALVTLALGDAVLAAQTRNHDPDLLLR
jgi:hypothetical protein